LIGLVAAVSVGMKDGEAYLDLNYEEDASCDTDLNVVMTQKGEFIELQGTAEEKPFTRAQADDMLILAEKGIAGRKAIYPRASRRYADSGGKRYR